MVKVGGKMTLVWCREFLNLRVVRTILSEALAISDLLFL